MRSGASASRSPGTSASSASDRICSGEPQLPHMRDIKEPGLRARVEVLVAGCRRDIAPASRSPANGTILAPSARWREWSGVRLSGAAAAARVTTPPTERTPIVRPLPPLSWTLRDSPEPHPRAAGLTPSVSGRSSAAAFQSALPPAVLLPESFRGGCSFGAAHPHSSGARPLLRACIQRSLCSTSRSPKLGRCARSSAAGRRDFGAASEGSLP